MSEISRMGTGETQTWERGRVLVESALTDARPIGCFVAAVDRIERLKDEDARAALRTALETHWRALPELANATIAAHEGELWAFVPGLSNKDSTAFARKLVEEVRKAHLGGTHASISVGCAAARPGLRAEVLLAVAREGLTVARSGGGDRAVHTDLYDLLQKKLTGQGLPAFKELEPASRAAFAPVVAARPRTPELVTHEHALAPAGEPAQTERVEAEVLERRIAKLMSQLAEAEERIGELERSTSGGLSSIYREVQGLAPTERLYETKRGLMASIFEANLALRARAAS